MHVHVVCGLILRMHKAFATHNSKSCLTYTVHKIYLDYCYPKWTNQIASLEVTIRDSYLTRGNYSDACEPLSHASVVTRCQPFKRPRPIACVCACSSLSRLDALSRKLRNLESLGTL